MYRNVILLLSNTDPRYRIRTIRGVDDDAVTGHEGVPEVTSARRGTSPARGLVVQARVEHPRVARRARHAF